MSVINQMLRDLEARRSDDLKRQHVQPEIKALPLPPPERNAGRYLILGLGLVLAAAGGWYAYSLTGVGSEPVPSPAAMPVQLPPLQAMLPTGSASLTEPPADKPAVQAEPVPIVPQAGQDGSKPAVPKAAPAPAAVPPAKDDQAGRPAPAAAVPPRNSAEPKAAPAGPVEKVPVATSSRERAELEYRKALGLSASGRGTEAMEALQAALALDPGHPAARQAMARHLLEARRGEEAAALLQEGLELLPAQASWAMALARLQVEKGDYAAAARTLNRSQAHAGSNPDYLGFLGYVQKQSGQNRDAIAAYQAAAQLAPMEGRWWLGLALSLEADGQIQVAGEAYRRALASGNLSPELAALAAQKAR